MKYSCSFFVQCIHIILPIVSIFILSFKKIDRWYLLLECTITFHQSLVLILNLLYGNISKRFCNLCNKVYWKRNLPLVSAPQSKRGVSQKRKENYNAKTEMTFENDPILTLMLAWKSLEIYMSHDLWLWCTVCCDISWCKMEEDFQFWISLYCKVVLLTPLTNVKNFNGYSVWNLLYHFTKWKKYSDSKAVCINMLNAA